MTLRTRWLVVPVLAAVLLGVPPATAEESTSAPCAQVVERVLNLGSVEPSTTTPFAFGIRNTGDAPLLIERVRPLCGCLIASYDAEIAPGQSGTIRGELRTSVRQGPLRKQIEVSTNDPRARRLMLEVAAEVRPVIAVEPADAIALPVVVGRGAQQSVTLRALDGVPFRVLRAETTEPYLQVEGAPAEAGAVQNLRLTVLPTAPSREFRALLSLALDHPRLPALMVEVYGFPRLPITAHPAELHFGTVALGASVTRELLLTGSGFRLLGAETSDPRLHARIASDPDVGFSVRVTCRGDGKPGPLRGVVTLRTDDPTTPRITVPYTATIEKGN